MPHWKQMERLRMMLALFLRRAEQHPLRSPQVQPLAFLPRPCLAWLLPVGLPAEAQGKQLPEREAQQAEQEVQLSQGARLPPRCSLQER